MEVKIDVRTVESSVGSGQSLKITRLPITEKTIPPLLRRKVDEVDSKSKHQIKKEKRAAKKNKKPKIHKSLAKLELLTKHESSSGSESDADIEDNLEEIKHSQSHEMRKGLESGYNSDKADDDSILKNRVIPSGSGVDESGVLIPAVGLDEIEAINLRSSTRDYVSPINETVEGFETSKYRLSCAKTSTNLKEDLEKMSLFANEDDGKLMDIHAANDLHDEACCKMAEENKMENNDLELWTGTMTQRYQCEDGELSVQSCLDQFTACELMTANNKVSCALCTKGNGGQEKGTVYTTATKQLLIYNPPAVLILHLKRFQVYHFRPTKVSKHVTFPTQLDLAPYCSKRSLNLPTFDAGQNEVLYSLYGVVEHSGSIHGGHYVAYIKVRPKLSNDNYRWQFLPKNQEEKKLLECGKGAHGLPDIPLGKWFYVSDSHVSEVQESKVLNAQAYLLFYERIF